MQSTEIRFWSKVELPSKIGTQQCWIWRGELNNRGYGRFWFIRRKELAHRMAYYLANQWWLDWWFDSRYEVMHSCDNPLCVNPDHLRLGTHADNMRDMAAKGRSGMPNVKLLPEEVVMIRRVALKGHLSQSKIGEIFGIGQSHVSRIVNRQCWRVVRGVFK